MSSFYTGVGDDGYTALLGRERVPKYHFRPEAYGEIDEASAALGLARAFATMDRSKEIILQIQKDLYGLMAEVAATPENAEKFRIISFQHLNRIEQETNALSQIVKIPNEFILPGDSISSATLSLARTIIRRAERRVTRLVHEGELQNEAILPYLNRLSSLVFLLELFENQSSGKHSPTLAKDALNE
jgi:cob(I)alamin adenosyltransferase